MPDAKMTQRIMQAVDENFSEQLDFICELTRFPSLRCQEAPAQDFMAKTLRERGYSIDRWCIDVEDIQHLPGFSPVRVSYEDSWNVVGTHRPRSVAGRSLILNGHVDVVPTGPLDMWASPPFEPRIDSGWLYGRGTGDMKAGLAINLYALDALRRLGLQPAAEVYIQSVVEEECTGNGALACLQRGYRGEAAIIPEPVGDALCYAQVGVIWFQIRVAGKPAHAGTAGHGFNAIEACIPLIQALHQLEAAWNAKPHPLYHHHHHPIHFVVSGIEGGDWTSSVPSWCNFNLRVGIYPDKNVEEACREVEAVIMDTARHNPHLSNNPPRIDYHGFRSPGYVLPAHTDAEHTLQGAYHTVFGRGLARVAATALTDARFFGLYQNTPALVYGPAAEDIHAFDERVNIESVRQVTQVIALFIADWCGLETIG